MQVERIFTDPGYFAIGCNYWASHAGTHMWRDWDEATVRADFARLADVGLQLIRVFPLWPDFQKITTHATYHQRPRQMRMGEEQMPRTEAGRAGVDPVAMEHFRTLADIADENGLKLLVGLVTGWMSARMFVPPALEKLNIMTDPLAIQWQVRFVRYFVKTLKDHSAIVAWELGNECNCMGAVNSPQQAWNWTNAIASAIRAEDDSRPVCSGMHSLVPAAYDDLAPAGNWSMQDQGELTDMLTAHPYPFSPSKTAARIDPQDTIRAAFQATVETRMYADLGHRPAMVEEIGTFGPSYCDLEMQKTFIRNCLLNLWAHDCRALLWWCGFEQTRLEHTPYVWSALEQELGLHDAEMNPKPVCDALKGFRDMLAAMPFEALPPRGTDAVCVLTRGQNLDCGLGNAWSAFVLAKQAGFDVRFQFVDEELEESRLYLVPGLRGTTAVYKSELEALVAKAAAGAAVYVSLDDGALGIFNELFGCAVTRRRARTRPAEFAIDGVRLTSRAPYRIDLRPEGAEVVAAEEDGNPVLTRFAYGKGEIWLSTLPLEDHVARTPGALEDDPGYALVYRKLGEKVIADRILTCGEPMVTCTEHVLSDTEAVAVLVNNQPQSATCSLRLQNGWDVAEVLYGSALVDGRPRIGPNDGVVLRLAVVGQ